jgi:hypothetical protein
MGISPVAEHRDVSASSAVVAVEDREQPVEAEHRTAGDENESHCQSQRAFHGGNLYRVTWPPRLLSEGRPPLLSRHWAWFQPKVRFKEADSETGYGMEARIARLAKNEALFREVNERIAEITEGLASGVSQANALGGLVCECADPLCLERVGPLTIAEYETVRSDPRRFIIAPGHESPDVENVVERQPTYSIVEKHEGVASDVARERDSRT